MSDHVSQSFGNSEDSKLVLGNTDTRDPVRPYQCQWMTHWTQASSSSSLRSYKHCTVNNVIKDQLKEHGYLPIGSMKPSYTFECKNVWRYVPREQNLTSYVLQSADAQRGEKRRFNIRSNSIVGNNVNLNDVEALHELSVPKLPASSINLENFTSYDFQNSKGLNSEWKCFPMFDINRKIETIMDPKKRTCYSTMEERMSEKQLPLIESTLAPHLIEFASEEHQHHHQTVSQTTDLETGPYESIKGIAPCNCHKSNMASCMCTQEENDLFSTGLAFKEHFANANLTYLKHELCNCSSKSTVMVSEMKNDCLRCYRSSWAWLKDGSNYFPGDVPYPYLEECGREKENVCHRYKNIQGLNKSNRVSNCSANDVGALRIQSISNSSSGKGGPQKFSNDSQYLLTTKKMGMNSYRSDQMVGDSTVSANVKGASSFEKLTLPTMLHHHGLREDDLQPLVNSTHNVEGVNSIDTQFMEKKNESSGKTDAMHIDVRQTPSSPGVESSSKSQQIPMDVLCLNSKRSEIANMDTSRTESMDVVSHVRQPSNTPMESALRDSEPSWKWVKRLQPNPLDPIPLCTKRFKIGDASAGEMKSLLTRVVNYNRSISDLPEHQQLDKKTSLPKNGEWSSGDSEKIIPWIRRWCRNNQEIAPSPVLCEPENSKVLPEKFEAKQFPSLAAMALMGKQMNNFRPCEFRKKGSIIVWNT